MITYAALSPHPPLIVPEVGGRDIEKVAATVKGMQAMAKELLVSSPDMIVFLTPHGNVFSDCISVLTEEDLQGDLGSFGRADIRVSYKNNVEFIHQLGKLAQGQGIYFLGIDRKLAQQHQLKAEIDHGILVPLYYLEKAGLEDIPIVAISVGGLDNLSLYKFGKLMAEAANHLKRRIAIVASGDMSHCLKEEGPYKYHPDGSRFDQHIKNSLHEKDVPSIISTPEELRRNAGECGYASIIIMLGALDGYDFNTEIFSYEGPFGVGYLVAGLKPGQPTNSVLENLQQIENKAIKAIRLRESEPVKWARLNLEAHIKGTQSPVLAEETRDLLKQQAGAFVSIKKNGQLRGCIGTFLPAYANLAEEIKANAWAAGLRDPRFSPVKPDELDSLIYSVDILSAPEACERADLDPAKYGVIVSRGHRRGLLLPDLEGVDSVEQQLQIALQKAGIFPGEEYKIERFEVKRFT